MLTLSRELEESIVFVVNGEVIAETVVVAIGQNKVKLATEAPASVGIYRREVWNAMERDRVAGLPVRNKNSAGEVPDAE